MKIIRNQKEWEAFKLNTNKSPNEYPVAVWKEYEDGGLGTGGGYYKTYYQTIPDRVEFKKPVRGVKVIEIAGHDLNEALWVHGFAASKGFEYNEY